jgi:hypothetical protein
MMREYIVEHERAFENATLEPELRQKTSERIAWAKEYVERVDPLKKPIELREPRESPAFWIDQDPDETD